MDLYIPKKLNFFLIKFNKSYILILHNNNFFITIKIKTIKYYRTSKLLLINKLYFKDNFIAGPYISNFIYSWDSFFLKKLKFKGKGYRILTKKNLLIFSFNHSHITWFLFFNTICRKFTKQKYIFIYKNNIKLKNSLLSIKGIKPLNIYTKRGMRVSTQKVFKKTGKRTT